MWLNPTQCQVPSFLPSPTLESVMKNAEVGVGVFCFVFWGGFFFSVILTVIYIFGAIKLAV